MTRVTVALLIVLGLGACGDGDHVTYQAPTTTAEDASSTSTSATTIVDPPFRSFIATALTGVNPVPVYESPGGSPTPTPVSNPNENGVVATFLVKNHDVDVAGERWHEVYLPVRPNGSVGWIRAADVDLSFTDLRLVVRLADHSLDLMSEGVVTTSYPIGVGRSATPTPGGVFYVKELLAPKNPAGAYGPYAFGLSGFSNTIKDDPRFGDGVIGIHGTNHPELVGTDVSHGCIRLRNPDITALKQVLPLGTPVEIRA